MKLVCATWNNTINAFVLPRFLSGFEDSDVPIPIFPAPSVRDVMRYVGDIICDLQEMGFTLVQDGESISMRLVDPGRAYDAHLEALPKAIIQRSTLSPSPASRLGLPRVPGAATQVLFRP